MNIKYDKGNLVLGLHELLESVDAVTKIEMIESLACDSAIIRHVADQIISGWTESMFSGTGLCQAAADPSQWNALDVAWREVAKRSGEVAKREIERLEKALRQEREVSNQLRNETCELRESLRKWNA